MTDSMHDAPNSVCSRIKERGAVHSVGVVVVWRVGFDQRS